MQIKEVDLMSAGPLLTPIMSEEHYERVESELMTHLRPYGSFENQFRDYLNILVSDLTIRLRLETGGVIYIKLKKGFPFDFASVPAWLRGRFPSNDSSMVLPALVHDALFDCKTFSFEQANKFYYEVMRMYGVGWWRAKMYYWGVSTGFGRKKFNVARIGPVFCEIDWRSK